MQRVFKNTEKKLCSLRLHTVIMLFLFKFVSICFCGPALAHINHTYTHEPTLVYIQIYLFIYMSICNNLCEHINNFSLRINYKTVRKKEKKGQPIPIFVATIRYMIQDVLCSINRPTRGYHHGNRGKKSSFRNHVIVLKRNYKFFIESHAFS